MYYVTTVLQDMKLGKKNLENVPTIDLKKFRFFSLHLFIPWVLGLDMDRMSESCLSYFTSSSSKSDISSLSSFHCRGMIMAVAGM